VASHDPRAAAAVRIHGHRGGIPIDRPDRPVGAARGLQAGELMAEAGRDAVEALCERVGRRVAVEGIRRRVAEILADTGFDPRFLELELTETFLMQESRTTDLVLRSLKQLGVKIALDDFGTGYSSLSYMRRFPVDT